jgi:ribosomal protein L10
MPSDKVLQRKQQQVDDLANELKDAASIVFADYKG